MALTKTLRRHHRLGNAHAVRRFCNGVMTLAVTIVLLSALPVDGASAQGGPAVVTVEVVTETAIADTRTVIGQLTAAVEASIATRVAGVVDTVQVTVGDRVRTGDILITLDRVLLDIERANLVADVEVAKAGVIVAEADVKQARLSFERQAALRQSGAFSRGRFEDLEQEVAKARAALDRSVAQRKRAEAGLAEIDYRITHSEIKAPFAGSVIARVAQPGAYVQVGAPLVTLLDITQLEIEADIPVDLVDGLSEGQDVMAEFQGGASIVANVRAIVPVQSVSTRTRPVRFAFDASELDDQRLARGKTVMLAIPASTPRRVRAVPKDALVDGNGTWTVFVVVDGKAEVRRVAIGAASGRYVEVLSGVEVGEQVVVRGNERLRPGQSVTPRTAEARSNGRS
ncbi:MAG: efflux RND transporter periplasmic adaptor subunit [Hyphomicrobiaceae bacterium]